MSSLLTDAWLRESANPAIIDQAGKHGNALTIWHREPGPELVQAADSLPAEVLPDGRHCGPLASLGTWFDDHLQQVPDAHHAGLRVVIEDMQLLARLFHQRHQAPVYTFRCHRLKDTMCPRFHADRGPMRLLCTYRGPGTEWLPDHAVDLRAVRTYGTGNQDIMQNPEALTSVPRFAAALLTGSDCKGKGGVIHRSPAIPDGASRLMFCMTLDGPEAGQCC